MISNENIVQYLRKAKQGDEQAKEIIFKNNSPLIKSIIRRFAGKGVEYDDLYQIACIGFLKAINNFYIWQCYLRSLVSIRYNLFDNIIFFIKT